MRARSVLSVCLVLSSCAVDGADEPQEQPTDEEPAPIVTEHKCATDDVLARQLVTDPKLALRMQEIEDATQRHVDLPALSFTSNGVVIIPTVVHVVHRTAAENISDQQIQSQIAVLNEDFRRMNSNATTKWPQAADTLIEFRLMGISRTATTKTSFGTNDSIKLTQQGGRDVHQPHNYLNMWVGNIGGGIMGYAQFPGGAPATDGVVIDYRYFGRGGTATPPFDLGRIATHEVGHYLNLRHIWGDSSTCGVDDGVNDTPDSNQPNYGCSAHSSCSNGGDMIENYMDYTDDSCMNLFTAGQKARMQALFAPGGARQSLVNAPLTPVDFGGGSTPPPATYQVIDTRAGLAAAQGTQTMFGPYNATTAIKFVTSGGTGDVDLYVKLGSAPSLTSYDCRPYLNGNSETCEFNPANGNYYVMLHGYTAYSNVTLTVSAHAGGTSPPTAEVCTDGVDNDGDSAIDCSDSECTSHSSCTPDEVCTDGLDNDGDAEVDCEDPECGDEPTCSVTISSTDFSSGFGPYTDGGKNTAIVTDPTVCSAGSCVQLRATGSIYSTTGFDLAPYRSFDIAFNFRAMSMEAGESFLVEMWNGSAWVVVASFSSSTHFANNTNYAAQVPVLATANPSVFNTGAKIRIRCNASSFEDLIYIDNLVLIGHY